MWRTRITAEGTLHSPRGILAGAKRGRWHFTSDAITDEDVCDLAGRFARGEIPRPEKPKRIRIAAEARNVRKTLEGVVLMCGPRTKVDLETIYGETDLDEITSSSIPEGILLGRVEVPPAKVDSFIRDKGSLCEEIVSISTHPRCKIVRNSSDGSCLSIDVYAREGACVHDLIVEIGRQYGTKITGIRIMGPSSYEPSEVC